MKFNTCSMKFICVFLLQITVWTVCAQTNRRPNIIVVLADDMGYADLGCFGSEIQTPNLDSMAREGVMMTNFYNASRCCPSRASLLTGVYPHQAGIGDMMNKRPYPAYQGYLNRSSVTLAEVLRQAGYGTYMAGKWHVGQERDNWPLQRGFDRYYGLIDGANSYFENRPYRPSQQLTIALDNNAVSTPADYYSTDAYTDHAITFIRQHLNTRRQDPFFVYLAFQAPHWPLHAKPQDIAKYKGTYMDGWDKIRERRFERQKLLGLFPSSTKLPPHDATIVDWASCTDDQKTQWDERMAVYAAMVDAIDQNVGRLVKCLQQEGAWENTIFLFLSDNGASHETITGTGFTDEILAANDLPAGNPRSFTSYGKEGAAVSNTPFRKYKHWVFEGGNATPFIAYGPSFIPSRRQVHTPAHLIDLMPSIVQWAGAIYPKDYGGQPIQPMEGIPLQHIWQDHHAVEERAICFEHEGNRAVRKGRWKLVSEYPVNRWCLFDLSTDRAESHDISATYPEIVEELSAIYASWAARVGVIPYEVLDKKRSKL